MALADLLGALEREALARIAADREATAAEAARILGTARELTARRRAEATTALRARLAGETAEAVALASRRTRGEELASRERLVERVLARVRARCREDPASAEGTEALVTLALAGLAYLERWPALARGSPALLDALAPRLNGSRPLRLLPDDGIGAGVRLESEDGRVTVDATLEGRLTHREDEARTRIVRRLGGPP